MRGIAIKHEHYAKSSFRITEQRPLPTITGCILHQGTSAATLWVFSANAWSRRCDGISHGVVASGTWTPAMRKKHTLSIGKIILFSFKATFFHDHTRRNARTNHGYILIKPPALKQLSLLSDLCAIFMFKSFNFWFYLHVTYLAMECHGSTWKMPSTCVQAGKITMLILGPLFGCASKLILHRGKLQFNQRLGFLGNIFSGKPPNRENQWNPSEAVRFR